MIELDLSYNQISNLQPSTFKSLSRLRKLVLRGNPLGKLAPFQFPNLRNLVNVDLAECRLSYVDPQAFVYLKSVEVMSLSGKLRSSLAIYLYTSTTVMYTVYFPCLAITCID
jgi:Leucine-rich repeat (LRR) protein